jgi:hypothetical protein
MFWFLTKHIEHDRPRPRPRGILHLSLADEKFGITGLPDSLEEPSPDDVLALDVLRGRELCLTAWTKDEIMLNIWTLLMVGEGALILMTTKSPPLWERRLSTRMLGLYHPMAMPPPCSSGAGRGRHHLPLRLEELRADPGVQLGSHQVLGAQVEASHQLPRHALHRKRHSHPITHRPPNAFSLTYAAACTACVSYLLLFILCIYLSSRTQAQMPLCKMAG